MATLALIIPPEAVSDPFDHPRAAYSLLFTDSKTGKFMDKVGKLYRSQPSPVSSCFSLGACIPLHDRCCVSDASQHPRIGSRGNADAGVIGGMFGSDSKQHKGSNKRDEAGGFGGNDQSNY